jgi:hypothetical protein
MSSAAEPKPPMMSEEFSSLSMDESSFHSDSPPSLNSSFSSKVHNKKDATDIGFSSKFKFQKSKSYNMRPICIMDPGPPCDVKKKHIIIIRQAGRYGLII